MQILFGIIWHFYVGSTCKLSILEYFKLPNDEPKSLQAYLRAQKEWNLKNEEWITYVHIYFRNQALFCQVLQGT